MPRPTEIATDARALYGPPSVRPAAGDMGDGALWVDPGDRQSLWQVQSGNWRQIALPPADVDTDDDSSVPAGVPVLTGPYVVNFSDIPHDGDTLTLWTPAVGDVLLSLYPDVGALTQWDSGQLYIGQHPAVGSGGQSNTLCHSLPGGIGSGAGGSLDFLTEAAQGSQYGAVPGSSYGASGHHFSSADPLLILWSGYWSGGMYPDPTAGHLELYALVARAVAP